MRIIGEVNHPECKMSIFYMNQKYIVKVEKGNFELYYKLSELDYLIKDVEDVKVLLTETFVQKCIVLFTQMRDINHESFDSIYLG